MQLTYDKLWSNEEFQKKLEEWNNYNRIDKIISTEIKDEYK
jgi:hypothetical protein